MMTCSKIADHMSCRMYELNPKNMILPREIGNVAHVFDLRAAGHWPYKYNADC